MYLSKKFVNTAEEFARMMTGDDCCTENPEGASPTLNGEALR